jgi:2-amino-4-hydroxy-6-hydroxymethyldihydropteridine diphosphokinase
MLRGIACILSQAMASHEVYLCIGGNLGDRAANLEETRMFIQFNMGEITGESPVYESDAWEMKGSPAFLNQVVRIETDLSPELLMREIGELEEFYGRKRSAQGYQDREMDVDILSFGNLVLGEPEITVPHPRLHLRKFVLVPLAALNPGWLHPVMGRTAAELLAVCEDHSSVKEHAGA